MGIKLTNNAFGTLAAGINSSATSITLTSGQGARFPTLSAGDYFYATLVDTSNNLEIVKCTARSTDVLTVVRGQETTTARSYSTGDRIEIRLTAQTFLDASGIEDGEVTAAKLAAGAAVSNIGYTPANLVGNVSSGSPQVFTNYHRFTNVNGGALSAFFGGFNSSAIDVSPVSGTATFGRVLSAHINSDVWNDSFLDLYQYEGSYRQRFYVDRGGVIGTAINGYRNNGAYIHGAVRAWARVQSNGAVSASQNCSSVTRHGTGDYTFNFSQGMPDASYSAVVTGNGNTAPLHTVPFLTYIRNNYSTSSFSYSFFQVNDSGARADQDHSVIVAR
jgi:hypothetical protein